jgi:hypothetical protein
MHHIGAKSARQQFSEMQYLQYRPAYGHRVPHNPKTSVEEPHEIVPHILGFFKFIYFLEKLIVSQLL